MKALFPRRDGLPPATLLIALLACRKRRKPSSRPRCRPGPPLAAGRGPDAVRHGHLLPGLRRWRAAVGLAVRRLGPATGAAGRPVHRPGGHPVRRLGARIRGAAGRALRPGAGTGNLLHHHADHAARPPAGRGTDPLLHHAGRRAVLVAGAGAAGGPAAGGPGGLSRRAGWHRGAGRPAAGSRMGPGRRNTDGPAAPSPCAGWRAACCATANCYARPCWWPA